MPDTSQPWIAEARAYSTESRIDLEASKLLKASTYVGIKRRRLYLLQQALEKAVKSFMPLMVVQLRSAPRMATYRMEFKKAKSPKNLEAVVILRARIERFAHRVTNSKELGHDPAGKLQLKPFIEDLYLFLELTGLPKEEMAPVRQAIESLETNDPTELFPKIEAAAHRRLALSDSSQTRLRAESKSKDKTLTPLIRVVDEVLVPNWFGYLGEIVLYIALASKLARYEQSCRYPSQGAVPELVIENIDLIEHYTEIFVGWIEALFLPIKDGLIPSTNGGQRNVLGTLGGGAMNPKYEPQAPPESTPGTAPCASPRTTGS